MPSTVTDQQQGTFEDPIEMDERRNISHSGDSARAAAEKSVSNAAETSGTSTVGTSCTVATETSTDNMETSADNTIIANIFPLPKAKPNTKKQRKKVSSAIITSTPVKRKLFPDQAIDSKLSTDEEEISFAHSESDAFDSSISVGILDEEPIAIFPKQGDFVIANVHTVGGKTKKFVGKLLSRQDEEEDFEISFLLRSNKIKNGFVFPEQEDLPSISKQDMDKILPPPCPVDQTKRLCGVSTFVANLSFVQ